MHLQASLPYLIGPRHSHLSSQFPVWCLSLTSHHTHKETDWLWVWVGVGVGCFHYFLFGVVSPSQIPFVSLLKRQVRAEQPKVWVHVSTAWNGCCDIGPVHSDTGYTYTSKEKKKGVLLIWLSRANIWVPFHFYHSDQVWRFVLYQHSRWPYTIASKFCLSWPVFFLPNILPLLIPFFLRS